MPEDPYSGLGSYGSLDAGIGRSGGQEPPRQPPRRRFSGGPPDGPPGDGGGDGNGDDSQDGNQSSHRGELPVEEHQAGIPHVDSGFGRLRIPMPERFSGHQQDVSCTEWVLAMCRWLCGNAVNESRWLAIMSANLLGPAILWMNLVELQVYQGTHAPFADWHEFTKALRHTFESATLAEQARRKLHGLRQIHSVEAYVCEF